MLEKYGPGAEKRLAPYFKKAGVDFPPKRIALLAFKRESRLELWAQKPDGAVVYIRKYKILAASGVSGPKLREGDRQVPEGLYQIVGLNPNSSYHLSMKLNFPNDYDMKHARREGRADAPGSNIFIHGRNVSIGCLAMGDPAIEELFTMIARTGKENAEVIIAPYDIRDVTSKKIKTPKNNTDWVDDLYARISKGLAPYKYKSGRTRP